MISFRISALRSDVKDARVDHELLLRITATFEILVDSTVIYREVDFPIVELAWQLLEWMDHFDAASTHGTVIEERGFRFDSMESAEVGLVYILSEVGGWRVGSAAETLRHADAVIELKEVRHLITTFVQRVCLEVKERLDIDLNGLLCRFSS